jgi:uncharacterized protein YbjT (DUF2867 family)
MSVKNIFVTGGTGNIGFSTLQLLDKNKFRIKVGVHSIEKGKKLQEKGFETVQIDFNKKEDLLNAFKEVDALLIIPPSTQNRGFLAARAVEVAKEAGVKYVVLFSVLFASEEKKNSFQKQFAEAEEAVKSSGLKWVILQAPYFQENVLGAKEEVQLPLRDGAIPFASVYDLARALVAVLSNPEPHVNKVYQLTGPNLETGQNIAQALSSASGKALKYLDIPPNQWKKQLLSSGILEWQADGTLELLEDYAQRKYKVTDHIEKITGKAPRSLLMTAKAALGVQAQ